jgi:uncharacterized membrane protein YedE/YeeE
MEQELNLWLIGGGLFLGVLFGVIVQRSRFCVLAAVSNWVLMRDLRQAHGYLAAVAVAVTGAALLEFTGMVPVGESIYRGTRIDWLGAIAGGAVFGFGVALAGGCAGRLLVRAAEGSAAALVALVAVGAGAAVCAYGVLAPLRTGLAESTAFTLASGDNSLTVLLGMPFWVAPVAVAVGGVLAIAAGVRRHASAGMVLAGILIGVLIVAGWIVTGYLARDEFAEAVYRPASLAFAGPLAQFMRFVTSGEIIGNGFPLAIVGGALSGAMASAVLRGNFRWTMPAVPELMRTVVGGGLMGIGAVFAGGCNIGQGLTGVSTLSLASLLAIAGMAIGMRTGLAWLLHMDQTHGNRSHRFAHWQHALRERFTAARARKQSAPRADEGNCCS